MITLVVWSGWDNKFGLATGQERSWLAWNSAGGHGKYPGCWELSGSPILVHSSSGVMCDSSDGLEWL